jgi:hypothetical protein
MAMGRAPKSGATAWEVRALSIQHQRRGPDGKLDMPEHYRKAIIAEALDLLADTLERERSERLAGAERGVIVRSFRR